MRTAFTKAELQVAQRIADQISTVKQKRCGRFDYMWALLRKAARDHGVIGKMHHGAFRIAYVGPTFVMKIQFQGPSSRLVTEAKYIQKMRKGEAARHFPLTQIIKSKNKKMILLIQEKVQMSQWGKGKFYDHVQDLGDRLGIEDCHGANYGWAGPKGREWPVFVDVDLRTGRTRKSTRPRSWMMAA